jgi:phage-related protein
MINATQILALAPDASSASSGKGLASASKWKNLGSSDTALWGECQGSGKDPYRTGVDLSDYTAKCSCPSRKFPCKHALGLMLLHAASPVAAGTAPEWVQTWLEGRQKRAEAKAAPKESTPEDLEKAQKAAAKRLEAREKKVDSGLAELRLWLFDQIRNGIASASTQGYAYWENLAARLTDAQAPGLARLVRQLPTAVSSGTEAYLEALARLHLIAGAYQRLDTLEPALQADVKTALGFNTDKAELLAQPSQKAVWQAIGQIVVQEDNLRVRRLYLENLHGQYAMLLDFAVGAQALGATVPLGVQLETEVVYYPSHLPLRALCKETLVLEQKATLRGSSVLVALEQYATALARLPWLERYPVCVSGTVAFDGQVWRIQDSQHSLKLQTDQGWQMLALSGGHEVALFGEFDGQVLLPLSLLVDDELHALGGLGE